MGMWSKSWHSVENDAEFRIFVLFLDRLDFSGAHHSDTCVINKIGDIKREKKSASINGRHPVQDFGLKYRSNKPGK